jgi:hypothetical protein
MNRNVEEEARILIASVEKAIANGTKHFDVKGRPLNTVGEVLEALSLDGKIDFVPRKPQ